jgi:hypothetical protein
LVQVPSPHRKTNWLASRHRHSTSRRRKRTLDAIKIGFPQHGIGLSVQIAYVLATVEWETAKTFKPVKEAFWKDEQWRRTNLGYHPNNGRGYGQLTS